ncbi:type VI secretion system contractile sheath large subunit [Chelatococcus sp. GCM10030263]|uniref:type VI secretion system contractile sheath large subunit n=1 Tax=Chelatococcus sp. GCM10030263 TaxID=3273387 RepID=UPI0036215758
MSAAAAWVETEEAGAVAARASARLSVEKLIARLDRTIGAQLDAILHHPRFQQLEAGWRGLAYLAGHLRRTEKVILRVLTLTWGELAADLGRALEFDQTQLFNLIYAQEFDMPGGEPYGLLLADFPVGHRRRPGSALDDVDVVAGLAAVATAAFAPVILPAKPELVGLDDFAELTATIDLDAVFRDADHRRWQNFRRSDEARFVGVIAPRVLMRAPYRDDGAQRYGFRYRETIANGRGYLWGSGLYVFGTVVARVFARHGWLAEICGIGEADDPRGLVDDLPTPPFGLGSSGVLVRQPVEINLSDDLAQRLGALGIIVLQPSAFTPWLALFDCPSLQVAAAWSTSGARANAALGTMLPYMLCVSRFAHYVKVIARDRIGSFTTLTEFEAFLAGWLQSYSISNEDVSPAQKARYPLRESRVSLSEVPGRPGALACVIHLRPHLRFQQVVAGFDLYTELASPNGL